MVDAYRNILVVIDGSEKIEKTLLEAVTIAKRNQATLHIPYVDEVTGNCFGDFVFVTTGLQEELDEAAENQMEEHRDLAIEKGLIDIETHVLCGYLEILIANFCESKELIDLIIMGATGLNAVERVLVGSTTPCVVNHASCNAMVVKQIKRIEDKKA